MKKQILLIIMILISKSIFAQDVTVGTINFSQLNTGTAPELSAITLSDPQRDKFKDQTADKLKLVIAGVIPAGTSIKLNDEPLITDADGNYFDITKDIRFAIENEESIKFGFKVIDAAHPNQGAPAGSFTVGWTKIKEAKNDNAQVMAESEKNKQKIITAFKSNSSFINPYDNEHNRVDLYFDENGKLLNHLPVNVDQNDLFYMHVLCVKGDENKYSVNIVIGDYAPADLVGRASEKLLQDITAGQTKGEDIQATPIQYTSIDLSSVGPFTSDNFKFQISYDSSGTTKNGLPYNLKVNKLYHYAINVSFVSTNLKNPDFHVFNNGTNTTIKAFDNSNRTLFTVNAIWYWSIFQQPVKGSVITGGRDILKDEPTFSITRVFPTFGVTVDKSFSENFFLGGVYEFARGGSIIAGLHYGKVTRLADKNFILEKTPFTGTDDDIQVDHKYKTGFFIGISVDTRIINAIFNIK